MSFKVLLTEPISAQGIDLLKKRYEVRIAPSTLLSDLLPLIADADAMLIRSSQADEELIKTGKKLKVIARHGIGVDNIDLGTATRLGIMVVNTPDANTNAVAEHSLWAIMHCARNFNKVENAFRRGDFRGPGSLPGLVQKLGYTTLEIRNKVLGLVGMGRIATRLAHMTGVGMKMRVMSYDPLLADDVFEAAGVKKVGKLTSLLKAADFLSLHVPYVKETHNLIGAEELAQMKPGAYLINAARGGVVNEQALYQTLKDGKLAGAALDVYENEPPDLGLQLFGLENVILTPHSAAIADLALVNMAIEASKGIIDVLEGQIPKYLVNTEVLRNIQ